MEDMREKVVFAIAALSTALLFVGVVAIIVMTLYMAVRTLWGF